jgi:predicted ATP-grasp superfamily ATP-dependent carboligase
MNVFVFEHLCGGITPAHATTMPDGWLRQGAAMLQAAANDFAALGADVSTMLHGRAPVVSDGWQVTGVDNKTDIPACFDELAAKADATLVIAPESNDALGAWLDRIEASGGVSLGCTAKAARLCGDKLALAKHLGVVNIATPATQSFDHDARDFDFPVVVKPRDGAGCEQTFLCRGEEDLSGLERGEQWIVQPFIAGLDVSASLIVHGAQVRVLLCGEQRVSGDAAMQYRGGRLPLEGDLAQRAATLAEDAVRWVPGLRGFVGVDMVLGETADDDRVIEINPRLTLSYVALRQACSDNLVAAMLDPDAVIAWQSGRFELDADGNVRRELAV